MRLNSTHIPFGNLFASTILFGRRITSTCKTTKHTNLGRKMLFFLHGSRFGCWFCITFSSAFIYLYFCFVIAIRIRWANVVISDPSNRFRSFENAFNIIIIKNAKWKQYAHAAETKLLKEREIPENRRNSEIIKFLCGRRSHTERTEESISNAKSTQTKYCFFRISDLNQAISKSGRARARFVSLLLAQKQ